MIERFLELEMKKKKKIVISYYNNAHVRVKTAFYMVGKLKIKRISSYTRINLNKNSMFVFFKLVLLQVSFAISMYDLHTGDQE